MHGMKILKKIKKQAEIYYTDRVGRHWGLFLWGKGDHILRAVHTSSSLALHYPGDFPGMAT
jgi:hypothetical protein